MTLGTQLRIAIAETSASKDQCKACQREGLPILPLRHALVPRTPSDPLGPEPLHIDTRPGLRTLRAGYLYVLLDRTIWNAYQVTPDGYLRQFNPYAPAPANDTSLGEACVSANHDCPASFLNIDTHKHTQAWLAFASDPWPISVLDAYKAGHASERFHKLDLVTARDNPASVGLAMTDENLQLDKQVYEYQRTQISATTGSDWRFYQHSAGTRFVSVHGFHSRAHRLSALKGFLRNAIPQHNLQQGVLAFVLDDTIGQVQEFNNTRNGWVQKRQDWMSDPDRAYQYQTSQLLLAIREIHRERAENRTPLPAFVEPVTGDGPPVFSSPEDQRERIVQKRTLGYNQDLEERYNEPSRAKFHQWYEQECEKYQHYIDQSGHAYAAACRSRQFACIEQNDYDGDDRSSGRAYSQTMALCLSGGISEAPARQADHSQEADTFEEPGHTVSLWSDWLKNPQSPIYRALFLRDRQLLADLLPSFNATGDIDWNDSEKLYAAVTKLIGNDNFKHHVRPQLQQAMAQLLGALNAAAARLQPSLGEGVKCVVSRINSASQLLYNGVHLTELKLKMKLGEYYALQCEQLRNLQGKAADAIDRTWEDTKNNLAKTDDEARKVRRQVRPLIQSGLLSLAVLDPKIANLSVTISVWVEGEVTALQDTLMRQANLGVDQLGKQAHATLVDIAVGVATLDPQARGALQGIKVSSTQVAKWVRTGFTGLRGAAGSSELLLAMGGMYLLSDSLSKSLKDVEQAMGDKAFEARLALYGSSLGVLGGGVELVGIALENGAKQVQKVGSLSIQAMTAAKATAQAGNLIVRAGGSIGAVAGLYDATRAGFAASRTWEGGDTSAAGLYALSTVFSGAGAGLGIWAAAIGASTLFGPLGIAIFLGLAGYGLYKLAEGKESTPLDRWVRRCYFGKHNEDPPIHWNKPEHAHVAIAELNAATLGVEAGVSFRLLIVGSGSHSLGGPMGSVSAQVREQRLEYRLVLPLFDANRSAYRWSLTVHRYGDGSANHYTGGEVLAEDTLSPPALATAAGERRAALAVPKQPNKPDFRADSTTPIQEIRTLTLADASTQQVKVIKGAIVLLPSTRRHNIEAATLSVTYWPDRDIHDAYAELILMDSM
ncbi:T6SS effector BTH_I2691 family protein [Pseudomonas atacamensis]|uniref:T6SS effector BTH_I2691 family protein n=1 Tax=Pseudomonas atacamensis TaxID=2565368 RepID=UPI0030D0F524